MITFGLGLNSVYGYAGQWLISLSDLMGDHRIVFSGEIQSNLAEQAQFFLYYLNSRNRFDYGFGAFYNRNYTNTGVTTDSVFHDITTGGIVHLQYPFSLNARTEFNAYYSHVKRSGAKELMRIDSSGDSTIAVPYVLEREFDIFIPTLSAVWDNTLWGITGPVNGVRAQASLTAVPPLQSMDASYLSLDIDARNYVHLARKFVIATRVAAGGSVALEDSKRSRRYFLGGSDVWLNYDVNRKNYDKNISNFFYSDFIVPFRGWDYCDLVGSRYAVANVEFRFPFIREIDIVFPLPMTLRYLTGVLFTDAGNSWEAADEHTNIPLPKDLFGGIGFGVRANLGFFILRYDRAWQTDWQNYLRSPKTYFSLGADF
jgi:outer membrane protein assembly factor BamA